MDLIKKNWGFLVYAAICLVVGAFLILQCLRAGKTLKDAQAQHQQELDFFAGVKKANLKLTTDNINLAEQNKTLAAEEFENFKKKLAEQYHLNVTVPGTPPEAVRTLRDEITTLQKTLEDKGIVYAQNAAFFTFDYYAKLDTLPPVSDLPKIFRHLELIKVVISKVVEAELLSVDAISRPLNLQVMQEDLYIYTPIEINVTGTLNSTQKFINLMSTDQKCLFFLRELEVVAPDEYTDLGSTMKDALFSQAGSFGGDMGGDMGRGRAFNPANAMAGGEAGPMDGTAGTDSRAAIAVPLKRQDLLVFKPKTASWRIRFDMVDFNLETEE